MSELGRVAKPRAPIAIYLYEDFSDRSIFLQAMLTVANVPRVVTTRLPHGVLFALCRIGSPVVFLLLTLPHRVSRRLGLFRTFADSLPFRHGKGPFTMAGDLYDRFSAPVEYRYSRKGTEEFARRAGLVVKRTVKERGWMVLAERTT